MFFECVKFNISIVNSICKVFLRENIHTVPAIFREFGCSSIYHILKLWQLQEIIVKDEDDAPEEGLHGVD